MEYLLSGNGLRVRRYSFLLRARELRLIPNFVLFLFISPFFHFVSARRM
jgi:hypothetical protein